MWAPFHLSNLATSHASLGQLQDACRCVSEAIRAVETTKEKWFEAEIHRIAGEIALCHRSGTQRKQKSISSVLWRLRAGNTQSPGNSAPQ